MRKKMKFLKRKNILLVVLSLILVGCGSTIDETLYEESIENGLDYFAVEEYSEAEAQFERALQEKEDDELAEALLAQTVAYRQALKLFEEEKFEEGFAQAETVIAISSDSTSISDEAEKLINNQKLIQEDREKEAEEAAKNEAAEKAAKEKAELEKKEEEAAAQAQADAEAEALANNEKNHYDYSDFLGYYLHFSSSDRSHSDTVAGIGHDQVIVAWWGSEGNYYDILNKSIEGNTLTIDYYLEDPYVVGEGDYGTMEIILNEEGGEYSITFDFDSEMKFYEASYQEVLSYDYSLTDFVN